MSQDSVADYISDDPSLLEGKKNQEWGGRKLAPFSEGAKMLWYEVTHDVKTGKLNGIMLLAVLVGLQAAFDRQTQSDDNAKWEAALGEMVRRTADAVAFKAECLAWASRIGGKEVLKGIELAGKMLAESNAAELNIQSAEDTPGK